MKRSLISSIVLIAALCSVAIAEDVPVTAANVLSVFPSKKIIARPGATSEGAITIKLFQSYHVNSNLPSNPYLIGLRLTWNNELADSAEVIYPKPDLLTLSFSETPVSVFSGEFELATKFHLGAGAPLGPGSFTGKLRFQACNNRLCLPPKTIDVTLPVEVTK